MFKSVLTFAMLPLVVAACGERSEFDERTYAGSGLSAAETHGQVDGGLTVPQASYRTFKLCKSLKAFEAVTDANAEAVTKLCGDGLIGSLREAPLVYDGSGLPNVHGDSEIVDGEAIEIAWFESVLVNATAIQVSAMERLRLTNSEQFRQEYRASQDITINLLAREDVDTLKIEWNNNRLSDLPQAFLGTVTIKTLEENQAFLHQWSMDEPVFATQSFTRLLIINQVGLNRTEVLTYTKLRSDAGGNPTMFKARTYDGRREVMSNLYENGPFAYKAPD